MKNLKNSILDSFDGPRVSSTKLFINLFDEHPNVYSFDLQQNQKIELSGVTKEMLNEIFDNVIVTWNNASGSAMSTSAVDDEDNNDDEIFFGLNFLQCSILVVTYQFICCIYSDSVTIFYIQHDLEWAKKEVERILTKLPRKDKDDNSAKVQLVCNNGSEYYTLKSSIKRTTINIEDSYNDDFKKEYDKLVDFLNSRESGLVLLHGQAGTGKTSLIRHLITNYPNEYIIVPNAVMSYISAPEFTGFVMEHKDSVFILEDCDTLLIDRNLNQFNNGISTILNMSDGILSDIFNLKFICTFNTDISAIDKALLRNGRCYVNYEFLPLAENKVEHLAKINQIKLPEIKKMTLADIFSKGNVEVIDSSKNDDRKIGFDYV